MTPVEAPTFPGATSGLLRKCSPVWFRDETTPWVVLDVQPHGVLIAPCSMPGISMVVDWDDISDLALDLGDETGRAHLSWWIADKLGKPRPPHHGLAVMGRGWQLSAGSWGVWILPDPPGGIDGERWTDADNIVVVPALADLDPEDPRLLVDGTRWVDAAALGAFGMHVAKRSSL